MSHATKYLNKSERAFLLHSIRRKRRNQSLIYGALMVVIITLTALSINLNNAVNGAKLAKIEAQDSAAVAVDERNKALLSQQMAIDSAKAAQLARYYAENQRELAIKSRREAENQRDSAKSAQALAIFMQRIAETAKDSAEIERNKALQFALELQKQKDTLEQRRRSADLLNAQLLGNQVVSRFFDDPSEKIDLAKKAYEIHYDPTNQGNPHDPVIYRALHDANEGNLTQAYNKIEKRNNLGKVLVEGRSEHFFSTDRNKIIIWGFQDSHWVKKDSLTPFEESISAIKLSKVYNHKDQYVVVGSEKGGIIVYKFSEDKKLVYKHGFTLKDPSEILAITFSHQRSEIYFSDKNKHIYQYLIGAKNTASLPITLTSSISSLDIDKSNNYLLAINLNQELLHISLFSKTAIVLSIPQYPQAVFFHVHYQPVLDIWATAYAVDKKEENNRLALWRKMPLASFEIIQQYENFDGEINDIAFDPYGIYMVAGTNKGQMAICQITPFNPVPILVDIPRKRISNLSFVDKDRMFVSVLSTNSSHELFYWHTQSNDLYQRLLTINNRESNTLISR